MTETTDERYALAIVGWQVAHGAIEHDLTRPQMDRLHAWERLDHDVAAAQEIVNLRARVRNGGLEP